MVDFDQFEMDLADFVMAILGPDHDATVGGIHDVAQAEAILMDVADDLGKSQECRDFVGIHTIFWSCLARLRPVDSSSVQRLLLKTVRNACIHCPSSQTSALSKLRADQLALDLGSSAFASNPRNLALIALAIESATNLSSGSSSSSSSSSRKFGNCIDPTHLGNWTLNMLLSHPTKALRLVMVWLANGILPMYPVAPSSMDRLSPGALVLERVFLMATPEKAGVEDHELAKAAGLTGFETDTDSDTGFKEDFTPFATAIVSALIRHGMLTLAYESSTNVVRADLLLHTHAVLADDKAGTLDPAVIHPMLDFFVAQLGQLVAQITATSPSSSPLSVNPVVLIELLHVLDVATLKLTYQPPALLTHVGRLLAWLHTSQPRATAKHTAQAVPDASTAAVFGTKKMTLLLIAQLVAGNPALQDQARDEGLVPLVLAQCTFDDHHPFIREYGIYCLRNLMLGNPENQALIEGMKVVDVAEETKEMLTEGGLKGVDPERLRERLVERERERAKEEVERSGWA